MKKINLIILLFMVILIGGINVNAYEYQGPITDDIDIELDSDINQQVLIDGAKVNLNLNGHNITNSDRAIRLINGAELTIKGEGTIKSTASNGISVESGSKLTLESGNIESQEVGVFTGGKTTFIMNGGVITTVDNCAVSGNGRNTDEYKDYTIVINNGTLNGNITSATYVSCGIYHPSEGTVTINGGVINSSNGAGIVQRGGTLVINGGTINTNELTANILGKVGDSRQVVPASAIVVDKSSRYPAYQTIVTTIAGNVAFNSVQEPINKIGDEIAIGIQGGIYKDEVNENLISEGYTSYQILDGKYKDKYVITKDDNLENVVVDGMVPAEEVTEQEKALVKEVLGDKYNLVSYYDIQLLTVLKNNDDIVVGNIKEAADSVKIVLGVPTTVPEVKEGFTRKYYVVKIHNGVATLIKDVKLNENGEVEFESSEFSTYVLAYSDTENPKEEKKNPNTNDNIASSIFAFALSAIGISGIALYVIKKSSI